MVAANIGFLPENLCHHRPPPLEVRYIIKFSEKFDKLNFLPSQDSKVFCHSSFSSDDEDRF